jgi:hypothetical protein
MFTYGSVGRSGVLFSHFLPSELPIPLLPISSNPTIPVVPPDPSSSPPQAVLECTKSFVLVRGPRSRFCVAQQSAEIGGNFVQAAHSKFCLNSYSGR